MLKAVKHFYFIKGNKEGDFCERNINHLFITLNDILLVVYKFDSYKDSFYYNERLNEIS